MAAAGAPSGQGNTSPSGVICTMDGISAVPLNPVYNRGSCPSADGNLRESRSVIDTDEIELEREWAGLDEGLYLFATDLWRLEGTASS